VKGMTTEPVLVESISRIKRKRYHFVTGGVLRITPITLGENRMKHQMDRVV